MSVSATSSVSNVATRLQQLSELRQQQIQVDLEAGESVRRVREQAVDQNMQDAVKQAERLTEIKRAGMEARSGGIDVWA